MENVYTYYDGKVKARYTFVGNVYTTGVDVSVCAFVDFVHIGKKG